MALVSFLNKHKVVKKTGTIQPFTHTDIGQYPCTYNIPVDKEDEFETLYYDNIIKENKTSNIVERQYIIDGDSGPILIDIDFRFTPKTVDDANHDYDMEEHIYPFVQEYMQNIAYLFELDEDQIIPVFILEKHKKRIEEKDNMVHDGVHIIIGLSAIKIHQLWLREEMVKWITLNWSSLNIQNKGGYDDVIDKFDTLPTSAPVDVVLFIFKLGLMPEFKATSLGNLYSR